MINFSPEVFVKIDEIKNLKKKIILYGSGEDGKEFLSLFDRKKDYITCIIDSHKKDGRVFDIPIYNFEIINEIRSEEIIVISTSKFFLEISAQLNEIGYLPKKDYIIWDKGNFKSMAEFIIHNRSIWKLEDSVDRINRIFIPYHHIRQVHPIMLSYITNYLLDMYNADGYGIPLDNCNEETVWNMLSDPWLRSIYESFNVNKFISDFDLTNNQIETAQDILHDIWDGLKTESDWMNIRIFGENFGRRICRNYYKWHTYPPFFSKDENVKKILLSMIKKIVFWRDYFKKDANTKVIIVHDGIYSDSFMIGEAIKRDIPVYHTGVADEFRLESCEHHGGGFFADYRKFFSRLTDKEKVWGVRWAKKQLDARLHGDVSDIPYMEGISPFASEQRQGVIEKNNKIKVLICPHAFIDDVFPYQWQIFTSIWSWLLYLGEISRKTTYDWYIKEHPAGDQRDKDVINYFLKQYPNIRRVPIMTSAIELKKAGIQFALTCWGTIGHEYPALGIQVINAGDNPHIAYNFNWHPKTQEEYENLLLNLPNLENRIDLNEIYEFYSVHYHYLRPACIGQPSEREKKFFNHPKFKSADVVYERDFDWYGFYLQEEWSKKRHEETKAYIKQYFQEMDNDYNNRDIPIHMRK